MPSANRRYYLLAAAIVLFIFYLSSPWTSQRYRRNDAEEKAKAEALADGRLGSWLETMDPNDRDEPSIAYDPPSANSFPDDGKPATPFKPFPLGEPHKDDKKRFFEDHKTTPASPAEAPLGADGAENSKEEPQAVTDKPSTDSHFNDVVFGFQKDINLKQPKIDLKQYAKHQPHNYDGKPGGMAFATFLSTRNSSTNDPYFAATQQLIFRNLWSRTSASHKHPFIVFVAPHISTEQRELFSGAGAIVRELPLVDWHPTEDVWGRWKDLFSKIHMWNQTDFSRLAFMDSDAFPIKNIDDIFDIAPRQRCKRDQLDVEDQDVLSDICDYTLSGVEIGAYKEINVGVMVLEPNVAMHARLMRNFPKTDMYANNYAEQAFLNWQFKQTGAFPAHFVPRPYNGFFPQANEGDTLKIVHEKIWAFGDDLPPWLSNMFDDSWDDMLRFYDSADFKRARERDDVAGGAVPAGVPVRPPRRRI